TSSRIFVTIVRMCGSSCATMRGVKPLFTSRRIRTCRGGSVVIIIVPPPNSGCGGASGSRNSTIPLLEINVCGARETCRMSSYLVIHQKPVMPRAGVPAPGGLRAIEVNAAQPAVDAVQLHVIRFAAQYGRARLGQLELLLIERLAVRAFVRQQKRTAVAAPQRRCRGAAQPC